MNMPLNTEEFCEYYLLSSCSSLCLRRGCTYVALKESVISKDGRLMLSNVHPLRWLKQSKTVNKLRTKLRIHFLCALCLCLHFSLVVKVHSIYNFLLPILDNLPNGASNHVSSWKRSDGKTMPLSCRYMEKNMLCSLWMRVSPDLWWLSKLTFQIDNLRVFQLLDFIKSTVHIIKGEECEIFTVVSRLSR